MPNLPGAADEPYDRRFAKWMIKNKVGRAPAGASRCSRTVMRLLQSAQPFHES